MSSASSKRALYAALTGNALIAVTKFAAAAWTGSNALLSEAFHSAVDIANRHPHASETEIRELLEGNLCRCTGYQNIVKAVQQGAAAMKS